MMSREEIEARNWDLEFWAKDRVAKHSIHLTELVDPRELCPEPSEKIPKDKRKSVRVNVAKCMKAFDARIGKIKLLRGTNETKSSSREV